MVDIPKDVIDDDGAVPLPGERRDALVQPGASRATTGRSRRRCSCCWRPSGRSSTPAAASILGNAVGRAARARRPARLPVHQHADGPGRATRRATRSSSACSGMHGTYEANMAMQHCDVLLAIGARFDDRVIGNPKHFAQVQRKIIHIDIDPSSISKRVKVDVPIVGDVSEVLQRADRRSSRSGVASPTSRRSQRLVGADQRVAQEGLPGVRPRARDVIKPQYVVETLWELTKDRDDLHHLRRRPAPDVGGAVLPLRQAAPLDQLRRPRHDGRRPAVRDGREARQARAPRSSASPAKARSRCASRSCRPASSTRRRSRSSS